MSIKESADYVRDLRALIGPRPVNFVGAAGIVQDRSGAALLTRRVGSEQWGLCTGISELGEALEDTLRRELGEELGLTRTASNSLKSRKAPDFSPSPAARAFCFSLCSGFIAKT